MTIVLFRGEKSDIDVCCLFCHRCIVLNREMNNRPTIVSLVNT
jgi:hypothetical protein